MVEPVPVSHSGHTANRLYYGWLVVAACLIIGTVAFTLRFSFGIFFKSLAADFNLNRATTSGIMSLYMISCAVVAISGGWLVDRYGPKKTIAVMGFLTGLSLLLASRADALWHLYLSYGVLLGAGTGAVYSGIVSTSSRWFIKRRGFAMALVTSSLGFGSVLQPVSAFLMTEYGWQTSYFILGLVAFCVVIPLSLLLKTPAFEVLATHEGQLPETAKISLNQGIKREGGGRFTLAEVIKTRNLWFNAFVWFCSAFAIFIILTHIVPHAIDLGISATTAAAILSIAGAVSILGRVIIGRLSDSIGRKTAAVISITCMAIAILWLVWASNVWGLYAFAIVFGFGWGGSNATLAALVSDVFGLQRLGVMVGIMDAGFSLGAALGPAFAGYIFDVRGSYVIAFISGMMMMLVAILLVLGLRVSRR